MNLHAHYAGQRVLVTGHTGFKGSWLVAWLHRMGAEVTGYSIDIPTRPSLFEVLCASEMCEHRLGDVGDFSAIATCIRDGRFDTVFHLAAQPLVRLSYVEPLGTLTTNVIGTANVLEAVRAAERPCAVVVVTSDKCYENAESLWGFRETDPMGGSDPYSMSKGAAELVVSSWRRSYFSRPDTQVRVASARAGNVIGGGDWAADRIVPDCVAALRAGQPVQVRNPEATRPWQHVVEPLSGYLLLGALLSRGGPGPTPDEGWNFGPEATDVRTVRALVERIVTQWGGGTWDDASRADAPKEAATLGLNIEKAAALLGWRPAWPFERTVAETVRWYRAFHEGGAETACTLTVEQIAAYETASPTFNNALPAEGIASG